MYFVNIVNAEFGAYIKNWLSTKLHGQNKTHITVFIRHFVYWMNEIR